MSTPGIGAALRIAHGVVHQDIFGRVQAAGHPGFTRASFPLWRFEGIDGRRPGEIAHTSGLSKQAVNDQLRALERLGYVELHADPRDGRARVVRLTERGWELDRAVRSAAAAVEDAWADAIGREAWEDFRAVLDRIAAAGGSPPEPGGPTRRPPAPPAGRRRGRPRAEAAP